MWYQEGKSMHGRFLALSINIKKQTNKIYIQLKVQSPCLSGSSTTYRTPLPDLNTGLTHEPPTTTQQAVFGENVVLQHLHNLPTLLPRKWIFHQVSHITMCIDVCSSQLVLCTSSLTKWKDIKFEFFFKIDYGSVVLHSTDWLSPLKNDGSVTGMPNILNL